MIVIIMMEIEIDLTKHLIINKTFDDGDDDNKSNGQLSSFYSWLWQWMVERSAKKKKEKKNKQIKKIKK